MLSRCFDSDQMMIYRGIGYGLADAFDGNCFDEHSGFNNRQDIVCEIFNSRFWDRPANLVFVNKEPFNACDFLISKTDAQTLASRLWGEFFGSDFGEGEPFPVDAYKTWKGFAVEVDETRKLDGEVTANRQATNLDPKPSDGSRWPWGNHHTELLGHLEAAATRFWVNHDPTDNTTAPTNQIVSDWLQSERKLSRMMADAIASMLRADGLPTGPRK